MVAAHTRGARRRRRRHRDRRGRLRRAQPHEHPVRQAEEGSAPAGHRRRGVAVRRQAARRGVFRRARLVRPCAREEALRRPEGALHGRGRVLRRRVRHPGRQTDGACRSSPAACTPPKRRRTCTPPCPRPPRAASSATPTAGRSCKNRLSLTVLADPDAADDRDVVQRLSAVLGVPANVVRARMKDATGGRAEPARGGLRRPPARRGVHRGACRRVPRHHGDAKRTVRDYPYGALASHVLG